MLKQKVFEFDCYDYFVEGRFFKRKETRYDYHMKFEFSDENYSIVIDRSCDQTVERKDTLVSSHAEVYLQDMPIFVMEPIAFQKLSGTAFRLKGHYVDYEEHLLDTGEKIYEQKKMYRTLYFAVPRDIVEDFIRFMQQKIIFTR